MARIGTIIWRGVALPGHEYCQLSSQGDGWNLDGKAIFTHEQQPCLLNYMITCDAAWHTLEASVAGWLGNSQVDIQLHADSQHHWWLNQVEQPQVAGCLDLDLNFSPSTNLLPIRRLGLAVGERADIIAAWLRFPELILQPLPQRYTRQGEGGYRYESGGGSFTAGLEVNPLGFVLDYPGIWQAEATIDG